MENSVSKIQGPAGFVLGFNKMMEDLGQSTQFEYITTDSAYLPKGLEVPIANYDFVIGGAGIGDLICHFPAFIYLAKSSPWVRGTIICPDNLRDLAKNIMRPYKMWTVHDSDTIEHKPGTYVCAPGLKVNGVIRQPFCNGTGGHLVASSFINFVNMFPPPPGADLYPEINFDGAVLSEECWELHDRWRGKYVVLTPGAISDARAVTGWYWTPIVYHIKKLGLMPVVLGKSKISEHLSTKFPDGFPYDQCKDLRDKTDIIEAAFIMKHAAATIGLDNGLIQIASCTDASIVCAYNILEARERVPNRRAGKFIALSLTQEELACANCQTNLKRFHPAHSFTTCLMGTNKCVDILFQNSGSRFKQALDQILS